MKEGSPRHSSFTGPGASPLGVSFAEGKKLVAAILKHPQLQGLRRFMLATQDAQGLYTQFGFGPVKDADRFMNIHRVNPYQQEATELV